MAQTFNDLYLERQQQPERGMLGFVVWTFADTALGIIREHVLIIRQGNTMRMMLTSLRSSALISFILVLPFLILEFVNQILNKPNALNQQNVISLSILFGLLWLLPTMFILILRPMVQSVRAGNSILANPLSLLLRVAVLVLIAKVWGDVLIDQLPCFLGVPYCD